MAMSSGLRIHRGQPKNLSSAEEVMGRMSIYAQALFSLRDFCFCCTVFWCICKIMPDLTRLLDAIQQGDPKAADELLPLVYDELRKLAVSRMANEAAGHTLQPTALVHEAWLRLAGK